MALQGAALQVRVALQARAAPVVLQARAVPVALAGLQGPLTARSSGHRVPLAPESEKWSLLSCEQVVQLAAVSHLLLVLQLLA